MVINMKRTIAVLLSLIMIFTFTCCGENRTPTDATTEVGVKSMSDAVTENTIRLVTTEIINDSGLLQAVVSDFSKKSGYTVDVLFVSDTAAALSTARQGNADLVLVNDKNAEKNFIKEKYGVERYPVMTNNLVIVGPADDPTGIGECDSAESALKKLAFNKTKFVSRADGREINNVEIELWGENVPNGATDKWYISAEKNMADTLSLASEEGAYCLTDKASFLKNASSLSLQILVDGAEDLQNTYTLIACNAKKFDSMNASGAWAFIEWATGKDGSKLIKKYGNKQFGEAVFSLIETEG